MKLSELKTILNSSDELLILNQSGQRIQSHFHLTEISLLSRQSIGCDGKLRTDEYISFQFWHGSDTEHRLAPSKLLRIIQQFENNYGTKDLELEIEFQTETIGRFALGYEQNHLRLIPLYTSCPADDLCAPLPQSESSSCCGSAAACCD